jgi:FkbM family methyltransferase
MNALIKDYYWAIKAKLAGSLFKGFDYDLILNNNKIVVPGENLLRFHQARCRLYDRFLPVLAKYVPDFTTIVDVGANCGDTLASMYFIDLNHKFFCIDADDKFYSYLIKNIDTLYRGSDRVKSVQCLVGNEVNDVVLVGKGTRSATKASTANQVVKTIYSRKLDDIVIDNDVKRISLIKSDVDGFDYDVLLSGECAIEKFNPVLFFECDTKSFDQVNGYVRLFSMLQRLGYNKYAVFDNFGALMLITSYGQTVVDLINYTCDINQEKSKRTIYYVDVLVFRDCDGFVFHALSEYRQLQSQQKDNLP